MILSSNFVISFQEEIGDVFEPIRDQLRNNRGRIRKRGSDYLAYMLLDALVDSYFIILENIEDQIEALEPVLFTHAPVETLHTIHHLKREITFLRKSLWPLRDVIGHLERRESPLIQEKTILFLRDVYDHAVQVLDSIETFRDQLSVMLDIYLSNASNKMNEIMKVLTIIATIFIPLTFIVGVYGMNFKYMPEIDWHWGYPVIWIIMIAIGLAMAGYFRKKGWM